MLRAALDTETTGSDFWHGCKPYLVSTCTSDHDIRCWEWRVDPMTRQPVVPRSDIKELQDFVDSHRLVMHNTKFDVRALETIGVKCDLSRIDDTLVAAHILDSAMPKGLKYLGKRVLHISDDDETSLQKACVEARRIAKKLGWRTARLGDACFPAASKDSTWWKMDMWLPRELALSGHGPSEWEDLCSTYAQIDAIRTIGLWDAIQEELLPYMRLYRERKKCLISTYAMETRGVTVSLSRMHEQHARYKADHHRLLHSTKSLSGNKIQNLGSYQQVAAVLYDHLKAPVPAWTDKGNPSTKKDHLEELLDTLPRGHRAKAFIKHLLCYRFVTKSMEYIESYQKFGIPFNDYFLRIHPNFNITGPRTTRFSSYSPNAQNISKKNIFDLPYLDQLLDHDLHNLRYLFGPVPGREWYSIDFDNIELRIFAYCSGDQTLIKAFEEGYSVHLIIAEVLWPKQFREAGGGPEFKRKFPLLYQWIKNGNFALIYGAAEPKADATYHQKGAYQKIRRRFPRIDSFMQQKNEEAQKTGQIVTLGGYPLKVDRDKPHVCVNYFVQGTAGWIMLTALNRVHQHLQSLKDYHINMVIHDEMDFDFPKHRRNKQVVSKICTIMEDCGRRVGIPTPASPDRIITSWAEGQPL